MGETTHPEPALPVVAVLHADPQVLQAARAELTGLLGDVRQAGEPVPFRWTDYYRREMGPDLVRCFLHGDKLVERQVLADLKRRTNAIERGLARGDGTRRVNLDPGLLTAENFVLASTKNRGHRVYLRDGIFAEVTLQYVQGRFECHDWTYPDYRAEEVQAVLLDLRDRYMHWLRKSKPEIVREVAV